MPVLANENHERYSRLRAILIPPRAAAKAIGLNPASGIATKLERNVGVRARIAELVADDEEILREKRSEIEATLNSIARGDGKDFPGRNGALKWPDRLNAINQLRDLHGFKAPAKSELTGAGGRPLFDLSKLTNEQLAALESIASAARGAPIA